MSRIGPSSSGPNDQVTPALLEIWAAYALSDDYVGSALAHEGIEPPDDVVARIAGDLRAKIVQSRM